MSLKIYRTQLTPARNALLDNIEDYLTLIENKPVSYTGQDELSYTSNDFQYIKPDIDIRIKIDVPNNNNNNFDSIGNYIRIEQSQGQNGETDIWYYFIISSKWVAQRTLELICSMDTVNTFHDYINNIDNWNEKTTINREHQPYYQSTNDGLINQVDRYSENFSSDYFLKESDTIIEEPNSTGVKEWYLVYQTNNTDIEVETTSGSTTTTSKANNTLNCYLYPSESFIYQRVPGESPEAFVRSTNDFINPSRYGIVNGKVSFSNIEIGVKYPGSNTSQEFNISSANGTWGGIHSNLTISGYVQVGDTVRDTDGNNYTCKSVIWYRRYGYFNVPMGVFYNSNDEYSFMAVYLSSIQGRVISPGYYVIKRDMNRTHIYIALILGTILSSYWIKKTRFENEINDSPIMDQQWGSTSVYIDDVSTLSFDENVLAIYKLDSTNDNYFSKFFPSPSEISNASIIYTNGVDSQQFRIMPLSELDRTLSTLVKIIALPYSPTEISLTGTVESGSYTYNFDTSILELVNAPDNVSKLLRYKNATAPSFGKNLNIYKIDNTFDIDSLNSYFNNGILIDKNINNEPKLTASPYHKIKFIYDNVNKEIRREDISTESGTINITPYFMPTNTIDSTLMFKFNFDEGTAYQEIYEWDKVLISKRDNEIPIFNNDYLNYLRYSYKTERENLEATARTQRISAWINSSLGTLGGAASGAWLGAKLGSVAPGIGNIVGAVTGGVIGLASGIAKSAATIINVETNIENAQRSMEQKLTELQNTSSTIINGGSSVDLMTNYSGNRLHVMNFNLPDLINNALWDKFYYCGYSHPVQEKPNMSNRTIFNFLQCKPVFINESNKRYEYYMSDIKDRFETGVTKYHNINSVLSSNGDNYQLYTDWEQKYENWYFDTDYVININFNKYDSYTTVSSNITVPLYSPSVTNSWRYRVEIASTIDDYSNNNWTVYITSKSDNTSIIFPNNNIPFAIRYKLYNTTISFDDNRYFTQIIGEMLYSPTVEYSSDELIIESQYSTSAVDSPYRYEIKVDQDGEELVYPFLDDEDYDLGYSREYFYTPESDFNDRSSEGYDFVLCRSISVRVVNILNGLTSAWVTVNI